MSRSGYSDSDDGDYDQWQQIMHNGRVMSAIRGKRGQAFLRELVEALDAMPEKKLIANDLQSGGGVCAIGSVGLRRGVDMSAIEVEDYVKIAEVFGIAPSLVQEIEWENDSALGYWEEQKPDGDERRWKRVRQWAVSHLREPT